MAQPCTEIVRASGARAGAGTRSPAECDALAVGPLAAGAEREVIEFLAARPLCTVAMAGLILDNGLESPHNRGTFYACRDRVGRLAGVALVGHNALVEARCDAALAALSECVHACAQVRMILGESDVIAILRDHFARTPSRARVVRQELLAARRGQLESFEPINGLRRAIQSDLETVAAAHALQARSESGVSPLDVDPKGFLSRTARRIEQGRVWVWTEGGRLIFKADVVSETAQAFYLEGVYVAEAERGRGYGLRCLSQLSRTLLARTEALCLLVGERNRRARAFYRRAGFAPHGRYDTIFLHARDARAGEGRRTE